MDGVGATGGETPGTPVCSAVVRLLGVEDRRGAPLGFARGELLQTTKHYSC